MLNGAMGAPVAGSAAAPSGDETAPGEPDPSPDGSFGPAPTLGATEDADTDPPGVAEVPTVGTELVDDGGLAGFATDAVVEGSAFGTDGEVVEVVDGVIDVVVGGKVVVVVVVEVVVGNVVVVVEVVVGGNVVVVVEVVVEGNVVVVVDVEVVVEPLGSVVVVEVVGGGFVTGGPVVVVEDGVSSPTPLPVSLAEACNAPVIDSIASCVPASSGANAMAITHDSPGSRIV